MLDDYGALIRSGQAIVPDYAAEEAKRQLLSLEKQKLAAQMEDAQRQIDEEKAFRGDLETVMTNPTVEAYSSLILKHPKFSKGVKEAWELQDKSRQQADLTQIGSVFSAAAGGKYDLAGTIMRQRVEADKAVDGQADPQDEAILAALESGDPVQQKAAQGMIGGIIAAIAGPEKFTQAYGDLLQTTEPELMPVGAGTVVLDKRNPKAGPIFESPYRPETITDPETGQIFRLVPKAAGATPGGGLEGRGAAETTVASTLSGAGLPGPVVAGFLGNFDAEGGYGGAKGDGGSAHGIAQWRGERQQNFQRVIGKPVSEASHADQARFVAWEMQNPEAAGMTVAQRDAILAAKTPAQAAALIDQYYERSSGGHRPRRMQAAERIARGLFGPGAPKPVRSKQEYDRLPKGAQYLAPDGSLRVKN